MTYATRKARVREWIKADAERRLRNEIARRVAEELCPPPTRPELDPQKLWSAALFREVGKSSLLKELTAHKSQPHDDMVDALKYAIPKR